MHLGFSIFVQVYTVPDRKRLGDVNDICMYSINHVGGKRGERGRSLGLGKVLKWGS
jgi:hypothetical protein